MGLKGNEDFLRIMAEHRASIQKTRLNQLLELAEINFEQRTTKINKSVNGRKGDHLDPYKQKIKFSKNHLKM